MAASGNVRGGKAPFLLALLILAVAVLSSAGCGRGSISREEVERIDEAFRRGSSRLAETTVFLDALERFDFENAAFLADALAGIEAGRAACSELRASMEELAAFAYHGGLEELGRNVEEYSAAMGEAVEELAAVYGGLEEILLALEPTLREEAVITQLEAPRDDAEFLERLQRLDAALKESLAALQGLEPPAPLRDYRDHFQQLLSVLDKMVEDIIAVIEGRVPDVDVEHNPDFLLYQQLMGAYPSQVEGIFEKLKIAGIDPLVEKVELEINRLYLQK